MQLLFKNLCIDHYPYHRVGSSIKHWHNYNHTFRQREDWSKSLFGEFVIKLETIINKSNIKDLTQIRLRNSINLLESCTVFNLKDFCIYKVTTNMSNKQASTSSMKTKKSSPESSSTTANPSSSLNSPNDFLKMKNYFIEQQLYNSRPFLSSNYAEFNLPNETLFANFFFSEFYFPEEVNYPVPSPQIFVQVSPILVNVDFLTLLWINTLLFSLWREKLIVDQQTGKSLKALEKLKKEAHSISHHCDTYFEAIMPKISLSIYPKQATYTSNSYQKRPSGIEIGFARILLTNQNLSASSKTLINFRSTSEKCYDLAKNLIEKNSKFLKSNEKQIEFDSNEIEINSLAPCFSDVIKNENLAYLRYDLSSDEDLTKMINTTNEAPNSKLGLFLKSLNKNALNKNSAKDIWLVDIESMWLDMFGHDNHSSSFIQNSSFKVYAVNVWDFYNSCSCPNNASAVNETEISKTKANEINYKTACERLGKVIELKQDNEYPTYVPDVKQQRKRANSLSNTSRLIKSQNKSNYLCKRIYSKMNIISEINDLHLFCNHSQILFLLRLVDTIDLFTEQIKIDTEQTLKYKTNTDLNSSTSNSNNNKLRIKSIKLEDLTKYLSYDEGEDDNQLDDKPSINLAFLINNIDVELDINDLRKAENENLYKLQPELSLIEESSNQLNEDNEAMTLTNENDPKSKSKPDEKLITKDDFDLIAKQLDKEFMNSYVKYLYGLTNENPNLGLSFQTISLNNNTTSHTHVKPVEKESVLNSSTDSLFIQREIKSRSKLFE